MKEFYVKRGEQGKVFGPLTSQKLRSLANASKISENDLISLDGDSWSFAANVQGLFPIEEAIKDLPISDSPDKRKRVSRTQQDDEETKVEPAPRRIKTNRKRNQQKSANEKRPRQKNDRVAGSNQTTIVIAAIALFLICGSIGAYAFMGTGSPSSSLRYLPSKDIGVLVSINLNDIWQHPEFQKKLSSQKNNAQLSLLTDAGLSLTQFTKAHIAMSPDNNKIGAVVLESSASINPESLLQSIQKSSKSNQVKMVTYNGLKVLVITDKGINYNLFFPDDHTICMAPDGSKEAISQSISGKSTDSILSTPLYQSITSKGYFSNSIWFSYDPDKAAKQKNGQFKSLSKVSGYLNLASNKAIDFAITAATTDAKSATDMATQLNQSKAMLAFMGVDKAISDAIQINASGNAITIEANISSTLINDLTKKVLK